MLNNKVVLVLCILLALWRLGMALYGDDEKKKIPVFVLFATGIYLLNGCVGRTSEVNDFFADRPLGLTWLSCVVMPVVLAECLLWMKEVSAGKVSHKLFKLVKAVLLIAAGGVLNDKGVFYITLMWLLAAAVICFRKGYAYVITAGGFKKRI